MVTTTTTIPIIIITTIVNTFSTCTLSPHLGDGGPIDSHYNQVKSITCAPIGVTPDATFAEAPHLNTVYDIHASPKPDL